MGKSRNPFNRMQNRALLRDGFTSSRHSNGKRPVKGGAVDVEKAGYCSDDPRQPWINRGVEMVGRESTMALDRMAATIMVTEAERAEMQTEAGAAGLSLAQYVRFQMQFLRSDFAEHYVWPSKWLDGRGRFRRLGRSCSTASHTCSQ